MSTMPVLPKIMRAAAGMAAIHFAIDIQATSRDDVLFVLDGHIADWSGWHAATMTDEHRIRFGRLLRHRPNQLANAEAAGRLLDDLLERRLLHGCEPADDYKENGTIRVSPGMPLAAFVDDALAELDRVRSGRRRVLPAAEPGIHRTTTRVRTSGGRTETFVGYQYEIRQRHVTPAPPPPIVNDAAPRPDCQVSFGELEHIAERIDQHEQEAGRSAYRASLVRKFRDQIQSRDGEVKALDLAAGQLNQLLAYTGFGKSVVLIETLACWAIKNEVAISFIVPTNANVMQETYQVERAAALFRPNAEVVPLMSPRSLLDTAAKSSARTEADGPDADWIWSKLGYGCALASTATTHAAADTWQPGREPCARLRFRHPGQKSKKDQTVSCPWRAGCGRFRLARAACSADVIITTHANLLSGQLHAPVDDGAGQTDQLSVEELLLRRCQVIVIDEVDTFQKAAIEQTGRGLLLDHGGETNTPLRRFDSEFGLTLGVLGEEVDATVRDAYFVLRYLSENFVSHLTHERLGTAPINRKSRSGPARYWTVPRRMDNWLTSKFFAVREEEVTRGHLTLFESLFTDRAAAGEPDFFPEVREQLQRVVTSGLAGAAIRAARSVLDLNLTDVPAADRVKVIDGMMRRAILEKIRFHLHGLMANHAQLVGAGVESAQEIADALGGYNRWRITPTGPLGRLVFAFTEYHDDTGNQPTRLSTAAFGGDPHTYVIGLGDTTALAYARTRRIVVGLSATSYFPGAPKYHVHIRPRWWVPDDNPESVEVRAAPIDGADGSPLKISGTGGAARAETTREVARSLWTRYLATELSRLKAETPTRARVLLATTSYLAAEDVAVGLSKAGVTPERLCLAVRPDVDQAGSAEPAGKWRELQADRLADFSTMDGAEILIAPLARVQRGVNIIGEANKSALGSVWLIVRPIPLIDQPAELVAHIQARALALHPGPVAHPRKLLADRRAKAGNYFDDIVRRPPYFQAQPADVQLGVVAEIINGAIQLIGRARRGGTPAVLNLVDGAFLDPSGGTDFASLIRRLRRVWKDDGVLDEMKLLYGTTLGAFFDYADRHAPGAAEC